MLLVLAPGYSILDPNRRFAAKGSQAENLWTTRDFAKVFKQANHHDRLVQGVIEYKPDAKTSEMATITAYNLSYPLTGMECVNRDY